MEQPWADLRVARWAGTKRSLHLYAQMLGKMRVSLSPAQPNWMFTPLYLTARGLTTGTIPWNNTSVEARLDVFDSNIVVMRSTGASRAIALHPVRTVAEIYAGLASALEELGVDCYISPQPQEVPDTTALDADDRLCEYDSAAVFRWFATMTAVANVFESWRAHFFGRSGIQLWWGAFDLALLLFSGKHVDAPLDRGYLMKYDLDAELMNVGLYLGDENTAPFFYAYIYPEPLNPETLPIAPSPARWSTELKEWVLPYDDVRRSPDPRASIAGFLDSIYELCFSAAGWDRKALSYEAPKRPSRSSK